MPSFTVELWRVLDDRPDDMTPAEWVGLEDYPIFDPGYRAGLNQKIFDHFMYQEIGHETVDQFRFAMRRRMNEIMPYFNQLYDSTRLVFDPLVTMDIRTIATGSSEQVAEGESVNETVSDVKAKAKNVASTFPQVALSPNKDYASSGADSNSETDSSATAEERSTSSNATTNDADSRTTGYQGSPAALIAQARELFVNVDMQVIASLDDLFMLVWTNGDDYTTTKGRFFY